MSEGSILDKKSHTPFWLDFENTTVGHTITVGPTSAGKSALLNVHLQALLAQQDNTSNQVDLTTSETQGEGE